MKEKNVYVVGNCLNREIVFDVFWMLMDEGK